MVARVCALFSLLVIVSGVMSLPLARGFAEDQIAASKSDQILGEWWTENNEGRVRISRDKNGLYYGVTTCCTHENDPHNPKLDINNPNPKQRGRSTVGIVIFWKLHYDDGEYVDGYVYNPRDGKTYRIEMKVVDAETVKIRGYMGISLLGQNQVWKRYHGAAKP